MRLLYVANVRPGSITERRIASFQRLGWQIETFDSAPYLAKLTNPVSRRLAHRLNTGTVVRRLNLDLQERARRGGYDCAVVAKGTLIHPATVAALRDHANQHICIHYSADPTLMTHRTRHFVRSVPEYSLCVTTKSYDIPLYESLAPRDVLLVAQGYDPDIALPRSIPRSECEFDLVFIGRAEPHYVRAVLAAAEVTRNIAVWGYWAKAVTREARLAPFWQGRPIFGHEYSRQLQNGRVALGLLTRSHPDQSTTRTFEIPAAGSFLLAERTREHTSLYVEGQEAAFFGNLGELQSKLNHYLSNPDERERVALAGQRRCLAEYSTDSIMANVLGRALAGPPLLRQP